MTPPEQMAMLRNLAEVLLKLNETRDLLDEAREQRDEARALVRKMFTEGASVEAGEAIAAWFD